MEPPRMDPKRSAPMKIIATNEKQCQMKSHACVAFQQCVDGRGRAGPALP
jgi:hypothetical protein